MFSISIIPVIDLKVDPDDAGPAEEAGRRVGEPSLQPAQVSDGGRLEHLALQLLLKTTTTTNSTEPGMLLTKQSKEFSLTRN